MDYTAVGMHDFYTFLLVFARVSGLMVAAPILGNRSTPGRVKAGLCLIFSMAVVPLVAPMTGAIPLHPLMLVGNILKDVLFGLALGYLSRVLFTAVEMAGYLIDTQMGFGFINLVNPFSEQHGSPLSAFEYQLAMVIFLLSSGHLMLLGAVVRSFDALPPGAVVPQVGFGMTILPMLKSMFVLGLQLAMPAMGVLLMVDVAFGLVARMVPQVNVFIVGLPAKIILGLMTVAILLPMLATGVGQIVAGTASGYDALIAAARAK